MIIVLLLILLCYGVNLLMALEASQCICTEKHQVFLLLTVRAQCLPFSVYTPGRGHGWEHLASKPMLCPEC